jgi:LysM repeat protein
MKKSASSFLILIAGIVVIGFSGCSREEEEDLTDWSIPRFEQKVVETADTVRPEEEYVVKKGDSLSVIAKQHGVSARRLSEANNLELKGPKSFIYPGQKLIIPDVNKTTYYYEK